MSARKSKSFLFQTLVIAGFTVASAYFFGVRPGELWHGLQFKAKELQELESREGELEKKYKELQSNFFELEKRHNALLAKWRSREEAEQNLKLTGDKEGNVSHKIPYEVPKNLSTEQRYLLAFSHAREQRFAEAAKTFDSVLSAPDAVSYQNAKTYYESGVAWFKAKNYKKARENFQDAKLRAAGIEKPEMQRKVELWMMLLDHQRQKSMQRKTASEGAEE